jgi:hypothetical protein
MQMNTELPRIEAVTKTGDERFHVDRENLPLTLLEFWRWSGSDLLSNAQRGVLAEFLVGSALQMTDSVRLEWDAYDIQTPSGLKVEVKNSSYIQSWSQPAYSTIVFDIAPKKSWDARENKADAVSQRSADVYVFCLLAHRDQNSIDPLNVSQWEFYVLATSVLDKHCGEQKTIRLAPLKALGPEQPSYASLRETVERVGSSHKAQH